MNKYIFGVFVFFSFLMTTAVADDLFQIKQIKITGLQRVEIGTVFNYLPVKTGEMLTTKNCDEIIKRLYQTGFFKDVQIERENDILIVQVSERPVIADLTVTGDKAFDHDLLLKSLKDNGLAEGHIFDQGVLDGAALGMKSEYYNKGLYSVVISPKVIQLSRNRVSVNLAIDEGDPTKIKSIEFIGNKKISTSKLKSLMFLTTGNMLSWWYKDNQYSSDKLNGDIEAIKSYYLNHGYINFKVDGVQVQLTPDKKHVYITIKVSEGEQYKIKSVKISGDTKNVPFDKLQPLILVKVGEIIDQAKITKTVDAMKTEIGNYGYAFATVNPVPDVDNKTHEVALTFFVDTAKKVYVRHINVMGNDKTRDVVVRREMRQNEDSLYNAADIARSKDRLNLLGYFKTADVSTTPVPGSSDQVDVGVKVDEINTGSINFGVGVAQGQGILLNGSISQANLFGSGKSATLSAGTSLLNTNYTLSFTDPYYSPNGTSLGYDLYDSQFTPNALNISPYATTTLGARARLGVPVSEFDKISFAGGVENQQISLDNSNVPQRFIQFTSQYGGSLIELPISATWVRNTTDSMLWPMSGATFNEKFDTVAPGVGAQYYRFTSNNTWFLPMSDNFVLKTNAQYGIINAYAGSTVPFYQNYFLGGIGQIRGYNIASLGPKDVDGMAIGGTNEAVLSNEVMFPLPGLSDDRLIRLSVFYDTASLWGGSQFNLTPEQNFRASYGLGVTWISPLGPIKVSYALPMFNQPGDQLYPFQYMMGTTF